MNPPIDAPPAGVTPTEILFLVIGIVLTVALVALFVAIVVMVRRDERRHAADAESPGSSTSGSTGNDATGRGDQA